jgi:hypothetical protein
MAFSLIKGKVGVEREDGWRKGQWRKGRWRKEDRKEEKVLGTIVSLTKPFLPFLHPPSSLNSLTP